MKAHVRSFLCTAPRSVLCTFVLSLMASSLLAADPQEMVPPPQVEALAETETLPESDDGCDETDDACCSAPLCVGRPLSVFVPNLTPGLQLGASLLYLKPGADNLGYATTTTFLPLQNPQWAVQSLNPQLQPGFSVRARYAFAGSGNDMQVNWDRLRTGDSAFVAVANRATQWISPFSQTGPSMSESANEVGVFHLKAAEGRVRFDYDQVNLDAGQWVNLGMRTQIRLLAGVTFVRLREQLISTFYNDPTINPVPPVVAIPDPTLQYISLNNTSTYSGLGPRLGLATACNLPLGFTCVGQLSGALLGGWMQPAQYSFEAVFDNAVNREQIGARTVSQVVYASDAKLGLGYARVLGNGSIVRIESGFQAAVFIHPFATYETSTNVLPLDIGSLSTSSMRHTPSNFTLLGCYLNCGLQW
ncbi:MAG: hypothetical protein K2Y37_25865 [Pirellulales bacterium]|nr:hypothetical protein [Pirellulales bacterium]